MKRRGYALVRVTSMDKEFTGDTKVGDIVACEHTTFLALENDEPQDMFHPIVGEECYPFFEHEVEVLDQSDLGMIVVGYQGIGKSTLSESNHKFVDLESSDMFFRATGDRCEGWEELYVNYAASLAKQGYVVFVSSHDKVREEVAHKMKTQGIKAVIIKPAITIKDSWVDKLEDRFLETNLPKDFRAWKNAVDSYEDQILSLADDYKTRNIPSLTIHSTDYLLSERVNKALVLVHQSFQ